MGRKKTDEETKPKVEEKKEDDAPEDTPLIKELKELDDKYRALEKEYEREQQELKLKYEVKQQPFLDQRTELLIKPSNDGTDAESGTPAIAGFWLTALKNHPAFEDSIEEWDEPVLQYLRDIKQKDNDEKNPNAGFSLTFTFVENPYFTPLVLVKEYQTAEENPYTGDLEVKLVKSTEIEWQAGKDVTIEKVAKKVKGGGAKKAKQKGKEKTEPRASFFRSFFRNMEPGMELPEAEVELAAESMGMEGIDDDDEELVACLMDQDHDIGRAVRDSIIPFAVRWYTGEAAPERDDDDEDDESEDDDEESDDEESEDDTPPKKKGAAKKGGKPGKPSPKQSPSQKPKDGDKEECKQQ